MLRIPAAGGNLFFSVNEESIIRFPVEHETAEKHYPWMYSTSHFHLWYPSAGCLREFSEKPTVPTVIVMAVVGCNHQPFRRRRRRRNRDVGCKQEWTKANLRPAMNHSSSPKAVRPTHDTVVQFAIMLQLSSGNGMAITVLLMTVPYFLRYLPTTTEIDRNMNTRRRWSLEICLLFMALLFKSIRQTAQELARLLQFLICDEEKERPYPWN